MKASEKADRRLLEKVTALQDAALELSKVGSFDDLCRRAIELGLERLGFDRLGLWFTLPNGEIQGSFGTDESGRLRDERAIRLHVTPTAEVARLLTNKTRLAVMDEVPLPDEKARPVGKGARLVAALWDGDEVIGCLGADNLIRHRPFDPEDQQLLALYATALGHLCSHQRAEEALRQSEGLYRTTIDSMDEGIHVVTTDLRIQVFNAAFRKWCRGLGLEADVLGRTLSGVFPFLPPQAWKEYRRLFRTGKPLVTRETTQFDHRRITTETRKIPVIEGGKPVRAITIVRDITEQMRMEEALRRTHLKLISAREEERRRLSRELHDSLAQKLVALSLRLKTFDEEISSSLSAPQAHTLGELSRQLQGVFNEVRHVSRTLYPAALESLGLPAALWQLADDMQTNRTRVRVCRAESIADARFRPETEIELFRIAQEALSNAIRHGKPRNVDLTLSYSRGVLRLTIVDDGKGFDTNKTPASGPGLGLVSMRERAEAIGGTFQVTSEPGRTAMDVRVRTARKSNGR